MFHRSEQGCAPIGLGHGYVLAKFRKMIRVTSKALQSKGTISFVGTLEIHCRISSTVPEQDLALSSEIARYLLPFLIVAISLGQIILNPEHFH